MKLPTAKKDNRYGLFMDIAEAANEIGDSGSADKDKCQP